MTTEAEKAHQETPEEAREWLETTFAKDGKIIFTLKVPEGVRPIDLIRPLMRDVLDNPEGCIVSVWASGKDPDVAAKEDGEFFIKQKFRDFLNDWL